MFRLIILLSLLLHAAAPQFSMAAGWPNWRGPERTGASRAKDLPTSWSAASNIRWKLALPGTSGSTPVIWGDRIFLQVAAGEMISLWTVSRVDGSVLWRRHLSDGNQDKRKGNLSSPSPVTDGETVCVSTGTGVLSAFDLSGERLWRIDLQEEFGKFGILHGYSSSPLLHDRTLFVQVLHGFATDDPSYLLAIDGRSGQIRWRVERPTDAPKEAPDAYTTPALLGSDGDFVVVVSGADYLTGHDPETGREIWRVGGLNPTRNPMQRIVASPVVSEHLIFVPSRVNPLLALSVTTSIRTQPEVLWQMDRGPDVPTPAVDDGYIYLLNDNGILWCLDTATGDVVWGPERIASATYSASPLVADGKLYATSESGMTTVMRAGPRFEVLAVNEIDEYTLASLAVAAGELYLRTAENLYCISNQR